MKVLAKQAVWVVGKRLIVNTDVMLSSCVACAPSQVDYIDVLILRAHGQHSNTPFEETIMGMKVSLPAMPCLNISFSLNAI